MPVSTFRRVNRSQREERGAGDRRCAEKAPIRGSCSWRTLPASAFDWFDAGRVDNEHSGRFSTDVQDACTIPRNATAQSCFSRRRIDIFFRFPRRPRSWCACRTRYCGAGEASYDPRLPSWFRASVAQLAEFRFCKPEVVGSSPTASSVRGDNSKKLPRIRDQESGIRLAKLLIPDSRPLIPHLGVCPSGQWGQTVNLVALPSLVRIQPPPLEEGSGIRGQGSGRLAPESSDP